MLMWIFHVDIHVDISTVRILEHGISKGYCCPNVCKHLCDDIVPSVSPAPI